MWAYAQACDITPDPPIAVGTTLWPDVTVGGETGTGNNYYSWNGSTWTGPTTTAPPIEPPFPSTGPSIICIGESWTLQIGLATVYCGGSTTWEYRVTSINTVPNINGYPKGKLFGQASSNGTPPAGYPLTLNWEIEF